MTMTNIHGRIESHVASWFKQLEKSFKNVRKPRENKPFVTISRESGAYGTTIADMLVEHLKKRERRRNAVWAVFDKELISKVIDENKFPEQYNKYFSESSISTVQDIMGELLDVSPPRETLVRKMGETIFHLAQLGYVILVGRGSNIITRRLPKGVHVRLVGSFEKRVAHMQEYLEIGEKDARDYIIKEDLDRKEFIKQYFHKDINDASLYDIVINLDTVPIEDAVRIIGDLIFKNKGKLKKAIGARPSFFS